MRRSFELARTAAKMTEIANMKILSNGRFDTSHGNKAFKSTETEDDRKRLLTTIEEYIQPEHVFKKTRKSDKDCISSATKDSSNLPKKTQPIINTKLDKTPFDYMYSNKSHPKMTPASSIPVLDLLLNSNSNKLPNFMDWMPLKSDITFSQNSAGFESLKDSEVTYIPVTGHERLKYVATCLPKTVIKTIKPAAVVTPKMKKHPEVTMAKIAEPPRITALAVRTIGDLPKKPDEPPPPSSSGVSRFLFRIIAFAVKLAILGGAVYWTQYEGVWGDGEKSEKLLRRLRGSLQMQHRVCMPDSETKPIYPTMSEISDKVFNYYNGAVSYCIQKVTGACPTTKCKCGCGGINQCGSHSEKDNGN